MARTLTPPSANGTGSGTNGVQAVAAALANNRVADAAPARPRPGLYRPARRNRNRVIVGVVLLGIALLGNLAVYRQLDSRRDVLQVVRDIPAGEQLTVDAFRAVKVSADSTVRTVAASDLATVIGSYAKVRLVSGSLLVREAIQPTPLVGVGTAVVAVTIPNGQVPIGMRERSRVQIVLPPATNASAIDPVTGQPTVERVVEARVVGLPSTPPGSVNVVSISFEVPEADGSAVARTEHPKVVLLDPGIDQATVVQPPADQAPAEVVSG